MRYRSGNQIREDFLRFFETKGHRRVHSSSLVPANDPTLLFTNAGMNQFKDVFLGAETRAYSRAATSQKCVRAGGKHNDLENVGFTRRHHTFFEMLGNFSFGDYFKREAIQYAWELLTSPEWFAIDPARLYVTIFQGDDQVPRDAEAYQHWLDAGVPAERIFEMGMKDNFWQMGDTGPCGPCSEIFYDLGPIASEHSDQNGMPKDIPFPDDAQRYIEIWNLVFMQFDRASDGTLTPLPKPSIDTGMGLERIACVLQGVLSNYQTDLFTPLIARAAELTNFTGLTTAEAAVNDAKGAASLRIIADHARAATFLIADGVQPANEGRGYVLRKILRRGIRHGRLLGQAHPFLHQMVYAVRDEMLPAYPELADSTDRVAKTVLAEEEQFARVLSQATRELDHILSKSMSDAIENVLQKKPVLFKQVFQLIHSLLDDDAPSFDEMREKWIEGPSPEDIRILYQPILQDQHRTTDQAASYFPAAQLKGKDAFFLYETYGLPLDFMVDAARDAGISFDLAGFELAKAEEQARARASWKGGSQKSASPVYRDLPRTEFGGYTAPRVDGARVLAIIKDGLGINELKAGDQAEVVLDATSFYADSGGQVGDVGWLIAADHQTIVAEVNGCTRPVQGVFAHRIIARQPIAINDELDTLVDGEVRAATMRNHTGTHLLHAALREVLGTHVKQAGSLVNPSRLRFDFSHFAGVADEELAQVEDIVNRQVLANTRVQTMVDVPIDEAVNDLGAMALFGEKYGDRVRVVKIGDFSTELCGGTHTAATGEIGLVKLIAESSVASGVRRVEAVSGTGALHEFRRDFDVARAASHITGTAEATPATLLAKVTGGEEEIKHLRRELDALRMKSATAASTSEPFEIKGIKLLVQRSDGLDKAQLRNLVDQLRTRLGSGIVVLGAADREAGKVSLIAGVTKDLTARIQAGRLVSQLALAIGGKGGGRADLAEAGGPNVAGLDAALASAASLVERLLT